MTRTSLLVAAAVAVLGFVPAPALAQLNLTGAWQVTLNTPQGENTLDVTFKQAGQDITGELTSPMGTAPFKGTLTGDALKVIAAIDMQGTPLQLTFDAKVTADAMNGTVKFGDLGEAPFTGKRKAGGAAAPAASTTTAASTTSSTTGASASTTTAGTTTGGALSGNWDLMVDIGGNQLPVTAKLQQSGNAVTGTIATPQGEVPVKGTLNGAALALEFEAPGGMAVTMNGTLAGSALSGKLSIPGFGDGDWTGKKTN